MLLGVIGIIAVVLAFAGGFVLIKTKRTEHNGARRDVLGWGLLILAVAGFALIITGTVIKDRKDIREASGEIVRATTQLGELQELAKEREGEYTNLVGLKALAVEEGIYDEIFETDREINVSLDPSSETFEVTTTEEPGSTFGSAPNLSFTLLQDGIIKRTCETPGYVEICQNSSWEPEE